MKPAFHLPGEGIAGWLPVERKSVLADAREQGVEVGGFEPEHNTVSHLGRCIAKRIMILVGVEIVQLHDHLAIEEYLRVVVARMPSPGAEQLAVKRGGGWHGRDGDQWLWFHRCFLTLRLVT